jgi:tetratricopeptide (TPR) repeat protein
VNAYREAGSKNGEAQNLANAADAALKISDIPHARKEIDVTLGLFRNKSDDISICANALISGNIEMRRHRPHRAYSIYQSVIKKNLKALPKIMKANLLYNAANSLLVMKRYSAAYIYYKNAMELYKTENSVFGQANCLQRYADIALAGRDVESARKKYWSSLGLYEKAGKILGKANCVFSLADIEAILGNNGVAEMLYRKAIVLYDVCGSAEGAAVCRNRLMILSGK